jgi:hypothetical protein
VPVLALQYVQLADWIGTIIDLMLGLVAIGGLSVTHKLVMMFDAAD